MYALLWCIPGRKICIITARFYQVQKRWNFVKANRIAWIRLKSKVFGRSGAFLLPGVYCFHFQAVVVQVIVYLHFRSNNGLYCRVEVQHFTSWPTFVPAFRCTTSARIEQYKYFGWSKSKGYIFWYFHNLTTTRCTF